MRRNWQAFEGARRMASREVWSVYESAWGETDTGRRAKILHETLDEAFVYSDPLIRTEGRDQLSDYIGRLQGAVPGMRIVTTSFEHHHESCLIKWTMQDAHQKVLSHGVTCAEMGESGRLTKAAVFYALPTPA
jgi:hypothetical protein